MIVRARFVVRLHRRGAVSVLLADLKHVMALQLAVFIAGRSTLAAVIKPAKPVRLLVAINVVIAARNARIIFVSIKLYYLVMTIISVTELYIVPIHQAGAARN